jgi:hypothetical protein
MDIPNSSHVLQTAQPFCAHSQIFRLLLAVIATNTPRPASLIYGFLEYPRDAPASLCLLLGTLFLGSFVGDHISIREIFWGQVSRACSCPSAFPFSSSQILLDSDEKRVHVTIPGSMQRLAGFPGRREHEHERGHSLWTIRI